MVFSCAVTSIQIGWTFLSASSKSAAENHQKLYYLFFYVYYGYIAFFNLLQYFFLTSVMLSDTYLSRNACDSSNTDNFDSITKFTLLLVYELAKLSKILSIEL